MPFNPPRPSKHEHLIFDKTRTEGLWCVITPLYTQFADFCEFVQGVFDGSFQ